MAALPNNGQASSDNGEVPSNNHEAAFCEMVLRLSQDSSKEPAQRAKRFHMMQQTLISHNQENSAAFQLLSTEIQNVVTIHGIPHPAGR